MEQIKLDLNWVVKSPSLKKMLFASFAAALLSMILIFLNSFNAFDQYSYIITSAKNVGENIQKSVTEKFSVNGFDVKNPVGYWTNNIFNLKYMLSAKHFWISAYAYAVPFFALMVIPFFSIQLGNYDFTSKTYQTRFPNTNLISVLISKAVVSYLLNKKFFIRR
jgi:hypothetical protein